MGSFGGFYKGEKKKKKKDNQKAFSSVGAPVFVPPKIIPKKRQVE